MDCQLTSFDILAFAFREIADALDTNSSAFVEAEFLEIPGGRINGKKNAVLDTVLDTSRARHIISI
jgi:hypothetical protein